MNLKRNILITLLLLFSFYSNAQEKLRYMSPPIDYVKIKNTQLLKLPFFDDFSNQEAAVNSELWENSNVYINNTLAINPPSEGVATFDAYSENSEIYLAASYNNSFIGDILSSQSIDLGVANTENVFLSFFFQAQGIGNQPETEDSLLLQFFAPDLDKWQTVWYTEGQELNDFQYVILPINQSDYLLEGFKFRFIAYCSYNSVSTNSTLTNADLWHIDYVYLDKDRSVLDNTFQDIAFLNMSNSFTEKYSSIPWKPFTDNQIEAKANFSFSIKNNDATGRKIKERLISWTELLSGNSSIKNQFGAININANIIENYEFSTPFEFTDNGLDSAIFEIKAELQTDDYDEKRNNHIMQKQIFKDYYAYDDGSSEASYGIIGEGSRNAMFAYQYISYSNGFLNAIDIYFNRPLNETYSKPFYLTVWNCKNGQPNEILYTKEGVRPQFSNELNNFIRYNIDTTIAVQDTVFIGWIQTNSYSLNLGYDLNRNSAEFAYYNIDGNWQKSALSGSVMMHPVITDKTNSITKLTESESIIIYPNPANNNLNIQNLNQVTSIQLIDLSGRTIWLKSTNELPININDLQEGLYILKFFVNQKLVENQKLIIQH